MELNRLQNFFLSYTDRTLGNGKALSVISRDFELQGENVSHMFNLTAQHAETNDSELTIKVSLVDSEQTFKVQSYKK